MLIRFLKYADMNALTEWESDIRPRIGEHFSFENTTYPIAGVCYRQDFPSGKSRVMIEVWLGEPIAKT